MDKGSMTPALKYKTNVINNIPSISYECDYGYHLAFEIGNLNEKTDSCLTANHVPFCIKTMAREMERQWPKDISQYQPIRKMM